MLTLTPTQITARDQLTSPDVEVTSSTMNQHQDFPRDPPALTYDSTLMMNLPKGASSRMAHVEGASETAGMSSRAIHNYSRPLVRGQKSRDDFFSFPKLWSAAPDFLTLSPDTSPPLVQSITALDNDKLCDDFNFSELLVGNDPSALDLHLANPLSPGKPCHKANSNALQFSSSAQLNCSSTIDEPKARFQDSHIECGNHEFVVDKLRNDSAASAMLAKNACGTIDMEAGDCQQRDMLIGLGSQKRNVTKYNAIQTPSSIATTIGSSSSSTLSIMTHNSPPGPNEEVPNLSYDHVFTPYVDIHSQLAFDSDVSSDTLTLDDSLASQSSSADVSHFLSGGLSAQHLSMNYAHDLPDVRQGVNFSTLSDGCPRVTFDDKVTCDDKANDFLSKSDADELAQFLPSPRSVVMPKCSAMGPSVSTRTGMVPSHTVQQKRSAKPNQNLLSLSYWSADARARTTLRNDTTTNPRQPSDDMFSPLMFDAPLNAHMPGFDFNFLDLQPADCLPSDLDASTHESNATLSSAALPAQSCSPIFDINASSKNLSSSGISAFNEKVRFAED